jgi:hypothetical protein
MQAKERISTFSSSTIFTFGLTVEFYKEFEGASHGIRVLAEFD